MSLLIVGTVAFDAVETPHGKIPRMLGGAATYAAVAASYFTSVRLVSVVGEDYTAREHAIFRGRPIDTQGLERVPGPSFFWSGKYAANMNDRTTLDTQLNCLATFDPKLPVHYRDSRYVFLANIAPALQLGVLKQLKKKPKLVALDTMNYWMDSALADLKAVLRHVDVLLINDSEARQLSGHHNLIEAAALIQRMGPHAIVIKRGEHGATLIRGKHVFVAPAMPLRQVTDPTGAGDSFAGGFMGSLTGSGKVDNTSLRRAMIYGSVMGSFAVERFGLDRLRRLTRPQIRTRAGQFRHLTQFDL
ncbi:MAG TPA: PfkB family carbohydrate kinase [Candidatus Acidoferrales bacterium]|nr:PfkB family carbohydrate kinase [Candidatus Acidoferrales bacterium]